MKIRVIRGVVINGKIAQPKKELDVDAKIGSYLCRIEKCIPANEGAKRDMDAVESKSMAKSLINKSKPNKNN